MSLLKAMLQEKKGEYVSEHEVMKILKKKWKHFTRNHF
jgi:HEPN domain-containing protein